MCAVDLTDSKGRFSTYYLLLTTLYDLRPSTAASISGEQRVLVFLKTSALPVALITFFKSLTQTF